MNVQLNLFGPPDEITLSRKKKTCFEYMLSLPLPFNILHDIEMLKKKLLNELKCISRIQYPSSFLLPLNRCSATKDNAVIKKLQNALSACDSIEIETAEADFHKYNFTCDLVLKTVNPESVCKLFRNVSDAFDVREPLFGFVPHITLARGISRESAASFNKKEFDYTSQFTCNSAILLRRELNFSDSENYIKLAEIELN